MAKAIAFLLVGLVLIVFFVAVQLLLSGVKTSSIRIWLKKNYLKRTTRFSREQLMDEAFIPSDVLSGEWLLNIGCLPGILAGIVMIIGAQTDTLAIVYIGGGLFLFFFVPFIVQIMNSSNPGPQKRIRWELEEKRAKSLKRLDEAIAAGGTDVTITAYRRFWRASYNLAWLENQKIEKKVIDETKLADIKEDLQAAERESDVDTFLRTNIAALSKRIDKLQVKK